ncbi:MAG: 4-hydroxy-tetrahydrodipicolinate reductase, partial [Myxococcota bacterium]
APASPTSRARGHAVTSLGSGQNAGGTGLTRERLAGVDVAIEFTRPDAAPANLQRLLEAGVPAVTGTTGWEAELPRLAALCQAQGGALLHAANFSAGVQLFLRAAQALAREMAGRGEFDGYIVEAHHVAKRDAPSGTARHLQRLAQAADPSREFPITSLRAGSIPGEHTLGFDGPHDAITLTHTARDRTAFAEGAVRAAEWLAGRRGVFTFEHVLFGDSA